MTDDEFAIMKTHAQLGEKVLLPIRSLQREAFIIGRHHELNGKGYPYQLKGNDIPLEARIIAIADAYHAMISTRPYRKGMSADEAAKRLQQSKGQQFDIQLVELFCEYVKAPGKHTYRFRPFCLVH